MSPEIVESFFRYVRSIFPVPDADIYAMLEKFEEKKILRKEFLFREGERTEALFFLHSGIYRSYCHKDGEEITMDFYFPPAFYANMLAVRERSPSPLCVQAMRDGEVLVAKLAEVDSLAKERPVLFRLFIRFFEFIYTRNQHRQLSFIFDTAEERYRRLFEQRPDVIHDIPLLHIATYLGIKPESLSRIRRKMTGKPS